MKNHNMYRVELYKLEMKSPKCTVLSTKRTELEEINKEPCIIRVELYKLMRVANYTNNSSIAVLSLLSLHVKKKEPMNKQIRAFS